MLLVLDRDSRISKTLEKILRQNEAILSKVDTIVSMQDLLEKRLNSDDIRNNDGNVDVVDTDFLKVGI